MARIHRAHARAHGAYTNLSKSATGIAAKVIGELEALQDIRAEAGNLAAALDQAPRSSINRTARRCDDRAARHGQSRCRPRRLKVNMVASECVFEMDIRLPNGLDAPQILAQVDSIVARYPKRSTARSSTTRRPGARPTPRWRS